MHLLNSDSTKNRIETNWPCPYRRMRIFSNNPAGPTRCLNPFAACAADEALENNPTSVDWCIAIENNNPYGYGT